ncbi:dedicator of cytokinesis protein 9-like isoform X2 [Eriocheir sinensis]|uniref:dedicator of cytokinesis protein 9-like isoform X2 n=1 Tax=Eriocheir sinensis TaxID=95602 RepID=UPI0021C67F6B|nr:dedicator of cytokinesis protein 9-like isoform X2 [Eriocheir sinensis]
MDWSQGAPWHLHTVLVKSIKGTMAERKFTRGLCKPGMAAQVRENVSQAVKATATQVKPRLSDPIDFEEYVSKNKIMLNNDPLRELLLYPPDDISHCVVPRVTRTLQSLASVHLQEEVTNPLVRQCLATYSQDLTTITHKYLPYSGSYLHLPRLPRVDDLKEQVYEVDTDIEQGDLAILMNGENILKKGYLLKGPESGNDKIFGNFSSKTFKRRFACLRQEVDGTYLLEFHKDERKHDPKGAIVMDFCSQITRNPKRGKCCFELQLSECAKSVMLSAESEADLEDWIDKLTRVIHADKPQDDSRSERGLTPPSSNYGTLRGLEHSLNPQLIKYAHETDFSIAQARREDRHQLFTCYPNLPRSESENGSVELRDESLIWPYEDKFGTRFRVLFENIKFRLQAPLDSGDGPLSQLEPYVTHAALYDVSRGCKVSEDFHFDLNNPMARSLLSRAKKKSDDPKENVGTSLPLSLSGIPEEWIAHPKQAVMSVTRPHSDVFLVIWIEKVLQGSISQTVEPYLKTMDLKSVQKLQRTIKTCCLRLGAFRMPFGWCARPLFKNSGNLDTESDFSPVYRADEKKLSESEFIRLLSDFRKPEKMNKLTTIPGSVSIQIVPMEVTLPNSLTPALEPVKPFPNPPTHEPTVEVQEFSWNHIDDIQPYVSYCNHLYVYPLYLNYENQKSFSRARNLVCTIELRSSDGEGATPLRAIYGRPGTGALTTQMSTVVLHHNTVPEWGDEVKILLPHNLSSSHHLLFTFSHVAIEAAKAGKKDVPVETVVGYSWLPLTHKGRLITEEQMLPVAAHLPAKYLSIEPLGLGKGFAGPEVRWVDNQKNVFRASMRLVSTVLSSDQHLHNFFQSSSSLLPLFGPSSGAPGASSPRSAQPIDIDTLKNLKALHALEASTIIAFFPTLLNQLFGVLLNVGPDVATNVTRVMVHIIDQVYEAGRDDILNSYIKYVMSISCHGRKTVHEELCHSLSELLQPSSMDQVITNKILRHSQFFFAFIARSMALHLLTTARIKMVRNERFNEEYQSEVRSVVELVSTHIVQRYKENPVEARAANTALAHFLKRCLSMMDRGYVFGLIKLYLEHFSPGDPIILHVYKFTLLRVVCSHEHFVPLNLPIFNTPLSPDAKKAKLRHGTDEFFLSTDFNSRHFLVGALLSELRVSLGEIAEVQRVAIGVLRDLLAKHAFDDRYLQSGQQGRIACLYFPIVSILLENVKRLSWPPAPSSISSSQRRLDPRASSRARSGRSGAGSIDMSTYNTPSRKGSSRADASSLSGRGDSSYLAIIAGPGGLMSPHSALVNGRSSSSLESEDQLTSVANSDVLEEDLEEDEDGKTHSRNLSVAFAGESGPVRYDKLCPAEVRDLLLCFLHILKHVPEAHLVSWWVTLSNEALTHFFTLLQLCLHHFKYNGKRQIVREQAPKKASTLPAKLQPPYSGSRMSTATDSYSVSSHEGEGWLKALQEANLASEVGLIVLDALGNFTTHCRDILVSDGAEVIMQQVFALHLLFLQLGQSENVMKHVFASIRAFINNFPRTLFQGDASLCGSLCFEMLKCCNSKLTNLRHEACAVLYLLMRSNYEFTRRTGINRVHLQVIISVSQLLGEIIGLNNSRFQESMALINSYATSDKAMNNTGFVSEVRDLTKRIRTVLVATAQMREHERDPEMLCDLQHSLAASYAATPELRTTWLQAMSKHHVKNGDLSEAAFCQLHIAALMAQYLRHQGEFPDGCQIFSIISDNIPRDESNLRLDAGLVDTVFTMDSLINQLELAGGMVERAERYELLGNLYRILIPIYEARRNYPALVQCYSHLYQAYSCVVEVNTSQKRLLGRYYRVAFFGPTYFEDEAGKEYVYKEPKVTSLAEISERLYHQYCDKFGKEVVKMIMDSNSVEADELESRYAYIQVTHVSPYFTEEERVNRQTEFDRNSNINTFMFETPFTQGGKAHGKLEEQWKRRVIIKTDYTFPYVKKRIHVIDTEVLEMSPIEVAIDEMESRVKELREIINKTPTDVKKLQLKLQGSISVQVNAGPLAYASTFLDESHCASYPVNQVLRLKDVYREFVCISKEALDLNSLVISSDQYEYQMALESNFSELLQSLSSILNEPLLAAQVAVDSVLKRSSQHYLSMISSPGGASSA